MSKLPLILNHILQLNESRQGFYILLENPNQTIVDDDNLLENQNDVL